jgi:hypothetical protein
MPAPPLRFAVLKLTMLKFTLRDLLWLTVAAALAIGWTVERTRREADHRRELAQTQTALAASRRRLAEAEDLLEYEGVVFGNGVTIHTTAERARDLRSGRDSRTAFPWSRTTP